MEPGLKFPITLHYLATWNSYKSLQYVLRVSHNTVCTLMVEICEAIIEGYSAEVMKCPVIPEEWKAVTEGFSTKWNVPHCVGAREAACHKMFQ